MGADRRGPLAAFVIVALIAAILLVTSVRSQAAPWFRPTVVAGPVGEPHLWTSVTGGVDRVVQGGTVLVRKAGSSSDPTRTEAQAASTQVVTGHGQAYTTTHESPARPRHRATHHHRVSGTPHQPADDGADQPPAGAPTTPADAPTTPADPPDSDQDPSSTPGHDHGHHLGWLQHQGPAPDSDEPAESGDSGSSDGEDTGQAGNGNGHGNGHAPGQWHGHGSGHAPGQWHGHAPGQGPGQGHDDGHGRQH